MSARYARNGGATVALPGVGPWTLQGPWRTLAPDASDTYVVTVRFDIQRGGRVDNDACAAGPGAGLFNAVRATVRGTGGEPDVGFDADTCVATPTPAWVRLRKQLEGRAATSDQAHIRMYVGGIESAAATTSGSGLPASAATPQGTVAFGSTVQFDESIRANGTGPDQPPGAYIVSMSCSNARADSPTVLPGGPGQPAGARRQWPEFRVAKGRRHRLHDRQRTAGVRTCGWRRRWRPRRPAPGRGDTPWRWATMVRRAAHARPCATRPCPSGLQRRDPAVRGWRRCHLSRAGRPGASLHVGSRDRDPGTPRGARRPSR